MSQFIKIGNQTFNMDLVTDIVDADEGVKLYFAAPGSSNTGIRIKTFEGADADLLRWWLASRITDVAAEKEKTGIGPIVEEDESPLGSYRG